MNNDYWAPFRQALVSSYLLVASHRNSVARHRDSVASHRNSVPRYKHLLFAGYGDLVGDRRYLLFVHHLYPHLYLFSDFHLHSRRTGDTSCPRLSLHSRIIRTYANCLMYPKCRGDSRIAPTVYSVNA